MRKVLTLAAAVVLAPLLATRTEASCAASTPMAHGFDSYFICSTPFTRAEALAYQITDPLGTDTGTEDIACESCVMSGSGPVTILADWAWAGISGCPVRQGAPNRVVIVLQDDYGRRVVVSLSGADPALGYFVEAAHPFDPVAEVVLPLTCGEDGGSPQIVTSVPRPDGRVAVRLWAQPPTVFSDCDPGSVGRLPGFAACSDGFVADPQLAGIFTTVLPWSGQRPAGFLRRDLWTDTGVRFDANGAADIVVPAPRWGEGWLAVGYTAVIGGMESGAIIGYALVEPPDCWDEDGDGYGWCHGDCADTNPSIHPGAPETCNGIDDDCDLSVDEGPGGVDPDGDGLPGACDNCPLVANADQADRDGDLLGDVCDSCPTIHNPANDPEACRLAIVDIGISFNTAGSRGSGTVTWTTTREVDIAYFNVVVYDPQREVYITQNDVAIRCEECTSGDGHTYTFLIPKHKSGRNLYIEMVCPHDCPRYWGPAVRQ